MARRAVFLDKDGTLVEDIPYNVDPQLIEPMSGALDGLRALHKAGFRLVVVSNQSGVARGFFPEQALIPVERKLRAMFSEAGAELAGFYYCPHHPNGSVPRYAVECGCRKPRPGLLLRAAQEHDIDLSASWMVGDILNDMEAGNAAGCRTVLIDNGHESEWALVPARQPHLFASDLADAAALITAVAYPPRLALTDANKKQRPH